MEDFLDRLRNRPHHHRQAITVTGASVFTFLVGVIWLTSLTGEGGALTIKEPQTNLAGAAASGVEFSSETMLPPDVRAQIDQLKQMYISSSEALTATPEPEPYMLPVAGEIPSETSSAPNAMMPFFPESSRNSGNKNLNQ